MKTQKSKYFTLLEVMIGVSLLAIVSGTVFWRLHNMAEKNRFYTDAFRLKSTLVSTRSLAINSKIDFRLELQETSDGWNARLISREDPDIEYRIPRFSQLKIFFNKCAVREVYVDFYSSGYVGPKGVLTISNGLQISEFKFPELFYRQQDISSIPLHPLDLIDR